MINITINSSSPSAISTLGMYRAIFLARSTTQNRDSTVTNLQDCIDAGWDESTEAYEFCKVVFAQNPRISEVVIRSIYDNETITEVMDAQKVNCLYIAMEDFDNESKQSLASFVEYSDYIYVTSSSVDITNLFTDNPNVIYIHKAEYDSTYIQDDSGFQFNLALDSETTPTKQYPEAAWISRFGSQQPASILWLNKPLVQVVKPNTVGPSLSNYYSTIYDSDVATGSGKTMSGEWIDTLVFTKWLSITLRNQLFDLLCTMPKISYTTADKQILVNRVLYVLSIGEKLGGLTGKYEAFVIEEQRQSRNIKLGFKAQLLNGINSFDDIQGTITA
jgi:hypothetical protein